MLTLRLVSFGVVAFAASVRFLPVFPQEAESERALAALGFPGSSDLEPAPLA